MLQVSDLEVRYDGVPAVTGASLQVPTGEVVAVVGPSGCGKSSLLRAVAGLEPVAAGRICWDDADLARVPTHRRGFALMFQDGQLFAHLTVAHNVGYALRLRHTGRDDVRRRVGELLTLVGLEGYEERLPGTLSGGERQRVALARSLAADPRLLLLDEPLSSLDAGLRERLAGDLAGILRTTHTTTLLVTHDQEEAFAMADRLVVMRAGRIVQQGPVSQVWSHPADAEVALFLGYARVVDGGIAERLLAAAGRTASPAPLALRRSALRVDPAGPLEGTVRWIGATPDQVRLLVSHPSYGELDAVAEVDVRVAVGDVVRLSVDASRAAPLGMPALN